MVGHPHYALRRQKEALKLMSAPNNYSSRHAAKKLIFPHRTLRRWRQHFDLFGEVPASTWLRNRKGGTIRRKYSRLVTPVVKAYLQNLIHDTPQLYLDRIFRQDLRKNWTVISSINRANQFAGPLKKMFATAGERNEILRAEHHVLLNQITNNPAQFIFIDETAKDRNSSLRLRAWQQRVLNRAINRNLLDWRDYRYLKGTDYFFHSLSSAASCCCTLSSPGRRATRWEGLGRRSP
jgi:hypothetical protein